MTPLNGTKTHPLKPATIEVLRSLRDHGRIECYRVNPGSIDRLLREDLATINDVAGGVAGRFLSITEAGKSRLRDLGV